jgi:translation initiation factor IF-1
MEKENCVTIQGVIEQVNTPNDYLVRLSRRRAASCYPCGRIVKEKIELAPGDCVEIELSPFNRSQGRIITRIAR